jgi:hypothetical protein
MALMFEQAGHDLLEGSLPVTELHLARGRHPVELLVGQPREHAEGASPARQSFEQTLKVDARLSAVAVTLVRRANDVTASMVAAQKVHKDH